jgi:hypothetical protein
MSNSLLEAFLKGSNMSKKAKSLSNFVFLSYQILPRSNIMLILYENEKKFYFSFVQEFSSFAYLLSFGLMLSVAAPK